MKYILKIRRKGIVILPKKLRDALEIAEGDRVVAEVDGGRIVITPLKPRVVDIEYSAVEEAISEEIDLEAQKAKRMLRIEGGSRQ